jgi:mannan endo-1,6-alpha-mannosidase
MRMTNRKQSAEGSADRANWETRIDGIIGGLDVFFSNSVMKEVACEDNGKCDVDQRSFKAYLARWMAATIKVAPFTSAKLEPLLQASAKSAVGTCNAGIDGNQCGLRWTQNTNDGSLGVGEQMSALEIVQSTLIDGVPGPVTNSTGGTSKGNPSAGSNADDNPLAFDTITTGDKAGAGILTTILLGSLFGGASWMALK